MHAICSAYLTPAAVPSRSKCTVFLESEARAQAAWYLLCAPLKPASHHYHSHGLGSVLKNQIPFTPLGTFRNGRCVGNSSSGRVSAFTQTSAICQQQIRERQKKATKSRATMHRPQAFPWGQGQGSVWREVCGPVCSPKAPRGTTSHRALFFLHRHSTSLPRHRQPATWSPRMPDKQGTGQGGLSVSLVRCSVKTKACSNTALGAFLY